MPEAIRVSGAVVVPGPAITVRAVRSSGPGGQNVNKVSSKVEVRVDLARIEGLTDAARGRLLASTARRRDAEGRLLVTSQRTRDQGRNLADALDKVRRLVAAALVAPRRRRPTGPTPGATARRLREKRRAAEKKRLRGRAADEDET